MPYLIIEYMDGEREFLLVTDDIGAIRVREGQLVVCGGDGSYLRRGETRGFPMHNVRRWWTSARPDGSG